jgi:integrase
MPTLPLADEKIEALRPASRTWYFHRFVHGLALRVSPPGKKYPRGRKSWYIMRAPTQRFGSFPAMRLKVAVDTAGQLLGKVALGVDLGAEKKKAAQARRDTSAVTLAGIAALFKKNHLATLKDTTRVEWERYIDKDIVPRWGTRSMVQTEWKKAEIRTWLTGILSERGACVANDIYACMRRLFSWANEEEHIGDWTPFMNLKRPADKVERDRVLSMGEVKKILTWIKTEPLVYRAMWMTFFWTLARHRPVTNMKVAELDLDSSKWTYRGKGKKKGKYHVAPLPTQAVERLGLLLEANGEGGEYVFDSGRAKRNSSFETASYRYQIGVQASLKRCRAATKIDDFKGPHDIRRTMATRLAEEEFADENLIARILGHRLPGVEPHTLIYQRYARLNEQRKALQKLADWLDKVDRTDVGKLSKMPLASQSQAV